MSDSVYWYDYETTGTNPATDRAIQFAAVRTDAELNTISTPLNLFCYPGNDTVPNPEAILVTGISVLSIQQQGLNEAAFIKKIHREFAIPGTCVCGYNSIRFDDEFTRNLLYRNFYDPYAREWQSGNSRWDVIDLFRMAHALRPDGFVWPVNDEGVPSFRLEALAAANGVGHEDAHDALSDVLATIGLTKKLRLAQPKLYSYLFGLRQKREVVRQLYPLGKNAIVHVSSMYPAKQACLTLVLPLCVHPTNPNGVICFDLKKDPQDLIDLDPKELHRRIFTAREDLEDGQERIPLKTIHINRCPAIAPLSTLKGQEDRLEVQVEQCVTNMKRLQRVSGIVEKIEAAFRLTNFEDTDNPDLMLYQGDFFSSADKQTMGEVRDANPDDLSGFAMSFQDPRLPEMLFRYRARNFPKTLKEDEKERWDRYRQKIFAETGQPDAQLSRIADLRQAGRGADCLDELESYLQQLKQGLTLSESG
ncbi:MAG: exodeoxyribonuclease I [bacterium]|nr:exodeoxyribonuclease I [Gammaproteobacteria bacterium]HIL98367.1 exodeoxyribonuclease I [Pseudomonadales bacterium]